MDASSAQSVNILETFTLVKLDFCSYNFHMYRFSRSDKGEVDVYRFRSKHSSDHCVLFCHDPLSHLAIDASSCMKLMNTRTDFKLHSTI